MRSLVLLAGSLVLTGCAASAGSAQQLSGGTPGSEAGVESDAGETADAGPGAEEASADARTSADAGTGDGSETSDAGRAASDGAAPDPTDAGSMPYPSVGRSSWGRVGTVQVFDLQVSSASQVEQAAPGVDWVWGWASGGVLTDPQPWLKGNPNIIASRYFISTVDNQLAGHDLAWYQANHPDWILYDCDGSNQPTHDVAYQPGLPGFVPIDIENAAAVRELVHSAADYALAHHFDAVAADQVLFFNYQGGQGSAGDEWGCGVWSGSTFVRRYAPTTKGTKGAKTFPNYDPQWNVDMANWVSSAKKILQADYGGKLKLIVNNPATSVTDPREQQILTSADAVLDETGFADYGSWAKSPGLFTLTLDVMEYAQAHGTAYMIVNKNAGVSAPTPAQMEWSLATYLMGNEGDAYLWTSGDSYGAIELFPEYTTVDKSLGTPCGRYYGGASYSKSSPHVYYRRFTGGLVVVNSGSLPSASEAAALPAGHTYTDLESRSVSNPLDVASSDAYVLFTTNGCN